MTETTTEIEDVAMNDATEITKEIQNVIDDGPFPFQQVRLLVWEGIRKYYGLGIAACPPTSGTFNG